jgi:signal transduction histidine kinase/ActR/RegA family two-component response regulator
MPAAVLALGAVSLGLLFATNWTFEHLIVRDIARVRVVGEIQRDVSISHLWLEEYVSGDPEVPLVEIQERLDSSLRLSRALLERPGTGGPDVQPLEDPEMVRRARGIETHIELFEDISRRRQQGYAGGDEEAVAIGSSMDQQYDFIFKNLLADARGLELVLGERLAVNRNRSQMLFRTILFAWIAIVGLAVTGLWTRERRRMRAEAALRESEAQLLQSQKMEAVGRLAGGIAHDVNNYLAAITSQCELVKRKAEPGSLVVRKMDAIISSSIKVSALIKRLLAFSRQQPVRPVVIDLNRVVEELEALMVRLIGEDLQLESFLSERLWNVRIDPSQVEQILVNLLVNARDAMPTGGKITIETSNVRLTAADLPRTWEVEPGEYVLMAVSDTGLGIEPAIRDKIFEPFFTTKSHSSSSGLGLATVYGIVQQNGGLLTVYSEVGLGTTFKIYLPKSDEAAAPSAPEPAEAPAVGGTERLLLVEDNDELRASTKGVLQALGYRVTVAARGQVGLAVFASSPEDFDLVITDVVMPGMSGRELVDEILRIRPDMKVIFVSGYTGNVILRHGVLEAEVDFLEKPFTAERLAAKVREVLEREAAPVTEPSSPT